MGLRMCALRQPCLLATLLPGSPYPPGPRPTPLRWGTRSTRTGVLGVLAIPTPARATVALTSLGPYGCSYEVVLMGYSLVQHLTPRRSRPHRTLDTKPSVGPVRKQNNLRRRARLKQTPEGAAWHSWARAEPPTSVTQTLKRTAGSSADVPAAAALVAEPRKKKRGQSVRRDAAKGVNAAVPSHGLGPPRHADASWRGKNDR